MKTKEPLIRIGACYVFMRQNHQWHGCEVAVLSVKGNRYTIARATDVCEGLLAPRTAKKRKLKTWICSSKELW